MVQIALVGAGDVGRYHAEALQQISDARVVGVVDPQRERAEAVAEICASKAYSGLEACLERVDLVYVLTPPSLHRDLVLAAVRAGKHVVCEKPISVSLADAEAMVRAAREADVKLMVGFNQRFRKGFRRLKELVDSGQLGSILNVWSQRLSQRLSRQQGGYNWRTDPQLQCGMSIESLSHDIDLVRWMAGEIDEVCATVRESDPDTPGFDDHANVIFRLADGGMGTIHACWSSHLETNFRGVIGTRGAAFLQGSGLWNLETLRWQTDGMDREKVETLGDIFGPQSYLDEDRHFVECVLHDWQPGVTGEDGLAALRVSHAILASERKRAVVRLSEMVSS